MMMGIRSKQATPFVDQIDLQMPPLTCQLQPSQLTCLVGPYRNQLRAYLHMLAGVIKPESGEVTVCGSQMSQLGRCQWKQLRKKVGYISGAAPVLSTQHGLMNVMLPALYHEQWTFKEVALKARSLLEELESDFEYTLIPALMSSFQRSQIAMARALILDPEVLILNLPFYDLGAKEREKMAELLAKYTMDRTVCMIGGLQYPHFLEQHVQQIIYISETKVAIFNSWNEFTHSDDADVKELLSTL